MNNKEMMERDEDLDRKLELLSKVSAEPREEFASRLESVLLSKISTSSKKNNIFQMINNKVFKIIGVGALSCALLLVALFALNPNLNNVLLPKNAELSVQASGNDLKIFVNGKQNSDPSFKLNDLKPGDQTIRIEKLGYEPIETTININSDKATDLKISTSSDSGKLILNNAGKETEFILVKQPAQEDDVSSWKIYDTEKYSFKYPSEWVVENGAVGLENNYTYLKMKSPDQKNEIWITLDGIGLGGGCGGDTPFKTEKIEFANASTELNFANVTKNPPEGCLNQSFIWFNAQDTASKYNIELFSQYKFDTIEQKSAESVLRSFMKTFQFKPTPAPVPVVDDWKEFKTDIISFKYPGDWKLLQSETKSGYNSTLVIIESPDKKSRLQLSGYGAGLGGGCGTMAPFKMEDLTNNSAEILMEYRDPNNNPNVTCKYKSHLTFKINNGGFFHNVDLASEYKFNTTEHNKNIDIARKFAESFKYMPGLKNQIKFTKIGTGDISKYMINTKAPVQVCVSTINANTKVGVSIASYKTGIGGFTEIQTNNRGEGCVTITNSILELKKGERYMFASTFEKQYAEVYYAEKIVDIS